jgi:pimeloyl-ACP methyl ester carboxylesterase
MFQEVNGIRIFYEQSGKGKPIILLHGNGESHKIFDEVTERLIDHYTVYAVDSRGHGESTRVKELSYEAMMEDIAELIRSLKIEKPILYGFSDGGIIGIMLAIKYPDLLSRLIISGANLDPSGIKGRYLMIFRFLYLITKNINYLMMLTQPHIKPEELKKITIPTFILAGKKDIIKEEHTMLIAEGIPASTLQILDGENHMSYVTHNPNLYDIIEPYLD